MVDWSPLRRELAIWRREGLRLPLWWRDDDAVAASPALDRLHALSVRADLPLHLAVIPKTASHSLGGDLPPETIVLVHGWQHRNNAAQGARKSEFPLLVPGQKEIFEQGFARLSSLVSHRLARVFVPPWNRIAEPVVALLRGAGFAGLSTYGPRRTAWAADGLWQVNTHLDPIDWRGTRGLADPDRLVAGLAAHLSDRRSGTADAAEPLGLLTHHLVHDEEVWAFCEALLSELREGTVTKVDLRTWRGQPG